MTEPINQKEYEALERTLAELAEHDRGIISDRFYSRLGEVLPALNLPPDPADRPDPLSLVENLLEQTSDGVLTSLELPSDPGSRLLLDNLGAARGAWCFILEKTLGDSFDPVAERAWAKLFTFAAGSTILESSGSARVDAITGGTVATGETPTDVPPQTVIDLDAPTDAEKAAEALGEQPDILVVPEVKEETTDEDTTAKKRR